LKDVGVIFILLLSCIIGFKSGFSGFRGFLSVGSMFGWCAPQPVVWIRICRIFRIFKCWALVWMVRAAASCLNQDLQDLQDFLALGLSLDGARRSQLFGSGFAGFRGLNIKPLI